MRAPEPFKVRYGRSLDALVLALEGRVHYAFTARLKTLFDELGERLQDETLLIDLRALEAIDSTGMGLLARLGRAALARGRRAVLVCSNEDVSICLRSAAFDELFVFLEHWPFDEALPLAEVPLGAGEWTPEQVGRVMLEAHRDLASLSEKNRQSFADVISALEAECEATARSN
jgi:anti-anti-sigma factor